MSLAGLRKIAEEGVRFRSHTDGEEEFLSPERAMEIQGLLDSDIQMALDECPAYPADEAAIEKSLAASMRWAKFSKAACGELPGQACFGIVRGAFPPQLRQRSAEEIKAVSFDGYGCGLAVGEGQEAMFGTSQATVPHLPADRPRYLMGVGKPDGIAGATERGIGMCHCVRPAAGSPGPISATR